MHAGRRETEPMLSNQVTTDSRIARMKTADSGRSDARLRESVRSVQSVVKTARWLEV